MLPETTEGLVARAFPSLEGLPTVLRKEFAAATRRITVGAGRVLFEDGDACRAFPLLLTGSVRVTKSSAEGREILLYRIEPGQLCLVTSSCLLGETAYPARGVAEVASELVLVEAGCFQRLVKGYEPFRLSVFALFAERLTELMQLVEDVAFRRLDQRLASLLLSYGEEAHVSHEELANQLGSVRVVVSRLLRHFEDEGWIVLGRERVSVVDAAGLRRFAGDSLAV